MARKKLPEITDVVTAEAVIAARLDEFRTSSGYSDYTDSALKASGLVKYVGNAAPTVAVDLTALREVLPQTLTVTLNGYTQLTPRRARDCIEADVQALVATWVAGVMSGRSYTEVEPETPPVDMAVIRKTYATGDLVATGDGLAGAKAAVLRLLHWAEGRGLCARVERDYLQGSMGLPVDWFPPSRTTRTVTVDGLGELTIELPTDRFGELPEGDTAWRVRDAISTALMAKVPADSDGLLALLAPVGSADTAV